MNLGCSLDIQSACMTSREGRACVDSLTLAALGVLAYSTGSLIHEALGHGGACVMSGGHVLSISTLDMHCSLNTRLILAGGTLMNGLAGVVLLFILRITPLHRSRTRFFCWLAMTINWLSAAGYPLFSGLGGFGDWAAFIVGLQPQWLFRVGLAILGAIGYLLAVRFSLQMMPLIGSDPRQRVSQAARLNYIPYFTGGLLACMAAALNPGGWRLIVLSAAASTFGGTSALLWMHQWLRDTRTFPLYSAQPAAPITRSWPLVITGLCAALVFIFILGPAVPRSSILEAYVSSRLRFAHF